MCGITGFASLKGASLSVERLQTMCDTILHRGPDAQGMDVRDNVALGMRRLSIIDVAGGKQPIFNEDRTVRVVFNGEIYNFRELRADLESRGHQFTTNTDTEVIVHAYEEYGGDFPNCLNGMFAFALHDIARRKLVLGRDHIGIKPLFYSITNDYIIWGSEIKAVLASDLVERELDLEALGEFMAWEYVPGNRTLFKLIKKLEPGNVIELDFEPARIKSRVYWDIPQGLERYSVSSAEWEERVDEKIGSCVQRQLVSDVPLGAFLSGGVDSSLVVSAMGDANTFSIGFNDPSYNELKYATRVANHLHVKHTSELIEPHVAEIFGTLMHHLDDPIGDFSIFPTYLISRLARRNVTVSLSGDGGDELFGGYDTYIADSRFDTYRYIPSFIRHGMLEPWIKSLKPRKTKKGVINKAKRFVDGVQEPRSLNHARWRVFMGDVLRGELFSPAALKEMDAPVGRHILELFQKAGERDSLNRSLYVDVKSYLADNCLVKVDRMSMAVSLESRVPLLDKELVELAFSIPASQKVKGGQAKVLLKRVAARHIPKDCVYRPKEGFSIPIKNWLSTQFRPLLEEKLNPVSLRKEELFNVKTISRLKNEHLAGIANHSHVLWSLVVFQTWREMWLEG
jgi:asparagine synthase (glutamine-hydrolysing)